MTTQFRVPDASCGHCKSTIEGTVSALGGVSRAELDLDSGLLKVDHDDSTSKDDLVAAVSAAGYTPQPAG